MYVAYTFDSEADVSRDVRDQRRHQKLHRKHQVLRSTQHTSTLTEIKEYKKLSDCWVSARCDKISDSYRSAS